MARDAEDHIQRTLESLLQQTVKPQRIIVVDDGSTDGTRAILAECASRYPRLRLVSLPNHGYDIRRVPDNINRAWETAEQSGLDGSYFMISGDDCTYSNDYASTILSRMNDDTKLAVASGSPSLDREISREHSPAGSGRFIRCSFWREIGGRYPIKAGWETWLLYKAKQRGFKVSLFEDAGFQHMRPRGAKHQFAYWGAAMHGLGYQPVYALGRIAKNAVIGSVPLKGSLNMMRGYLTARFGSPDPFISPFEESFREFVYRQQVQMFRGLLIRLISRISPRVP